MPITTKGRIMDKQPALSEKNVVLVVDDTPENLSLLSNLLKEEYRVKVANNGEQALRIAESETPPALILLDIMMPGMDGYEVCRRLKAGPSTRDIPVIFLTAKIDIEDERKGLDAGAADYITKPISPPIVLSRIRIHLENKSVKDFLKSKSDFLEKEVSRRTREVSMIQDVTMVAMGSLAETRDNETGNHIRRSQHYVKALSLSLQNGGKAGYAMDDGTIDLLYKSAPLHDIGKVGIPDRILLKPERLTSEEYEIMKTHTTIGLNAIAAAERQIDSPNSFLRYAREIAWTHHERWDGKGYPRGLAGEAVPLSGRIMAVADVYDALISKRVYKSAFDHDKAVSIVREQSGANFDPAIVEAFLGIADRFGEIAGKFKDGEDHFGH